MAIIKTFVTFVPLCEKKKRDTFERSERKNLMTRHVKRATVFTMMLMFTFHAGAQNVSDYKVFLDPNGGAYRRAVPIADSPSSATLSLQPRNPRDNIARSSITLQDSTLWQRTRATDEIHVYQMTDGYSSREWVIIDGNLKRPGNGGGNTREPTFRVTVPAVDIDWEDYTHKNDETWEDGRVVYCPVTSNPNERKKAVISIAMDDYDLLARMSPPPKVKLTWEGGPLQVFRANGAPATSGDWFEFPYNTSETLTVNPLQPIAEFKITLHGPPDGNKVSPIDFIRGKSMMVQILADTDRNGVITEADEPGKDKWTIDRGALIPPDWLGAPPTPARPIAMLRATTGALPPGTSVYLTPADITHSRWLSILDAERALLSWDNQKRIPLQPNVVTNLYVFSSVARKYTTAASPDGCDLRLVVIDNTGKTIATDTARLKVAPLILPPECYPSEKIYSTLNIAGIPNLAVFPVPGNYPWTQDMAKFPKVQFNAAGFTDVTLDLDYVRTDVTPNLNCSDPLTKAIAQQTPMLRAVWKVGGDGGNIMATPPLPDEPYGKIMIGTKNKASKEYWERQGIQSVIEIDTSWLVVGHVDELFMWVNPTKVIYADPWKAADLLHLMIAGGGGMEKLWCGWTLADKNKTIEGSVIDNGKKTNLLTPMVATGGTTTISCVQAVFQAGDYLRVGEEILYVESMNGNQYVVARGKGRNKIEAHTVNDVIYALSPLMQKNLLDGWGNNQNNQSVASRIQVVRDTLKTGLGSNAIGFILAPVPVLFNDGYYPNSPESKQFAACTANLANCLVVNQNLIYYSDPGTLVFKQYLEQYFGGVTVTAVDVWMTHHCECGEVHCGTATTRSLPANPPWWVQTKVKEKWENEQ